MGSITKDTIEHVADLCSLEISDEEARRLTTTFSDTLDYVDVLNELDTSKVRETFQVTGLKNVYQGKETQEVGLTQDEALLNAPEKKQRKFSTKAVFDR
jgi:aspartyl-tRNA(Asn)/glutamyl-tRNA(Gln) amidotransferase subunit C